MTEKQFDVNLFKDNIKDLFKTYLIHSSTLTEQSIVKTIWREVLQQIEDSYREDVKSEGCNLTVEEYYNYTDTDIRYCKDCKNLGLDGMFGIICDVNGNNKNYNCPKYERK